MSLTKRLGEYLDACFAGVWVQSAEHEDAIAEVAQLCRQRGWKFAAWDIAGGLQMNGQSDPDMKDPLAVLASSRALKPDGEGAGALLLRNYHAFLDNAEITAQMAAEIERGKRDRTFIVVLSPVIKIPVELEKHFVVLEHDLPDREQLAGVAQAIATEDGEMPEGADLEKLLDASAGLTRMEAEGAFSLSLVRDGKLTPGSVWELRQDARIKLGSLYNEADYPENIMGAFAVDWSLENVAPPDYLLTLRPDLYEREAARIRGQFEQAVALAEQAFAEEFTKLIGHLTERLTGQQDGQPKQFKDSTVENLKGFFERFGKLSVRSNGELDTLVEQAQGLVKGVSAENLRNYDVLRQFVGQEMGKVQEGLDQLMQDRPRRNIIRRPK